MDWIRRSPLALGALATATSSANAGTVAPWFDTSTTRPAITIDVTSPGFGELLDALSTYFIQFPENGSMPPAIALLFQMFLLMGGLLLVLTKSQITTPYAPLAAALARSRILWIMARRPFERWADKWSFRPSRASSPPASTFKTSQTVKPS